MSSIFLSHNHADKPFVRRLAQDLESAGVRVWLDEAEIMIGDSLIEKIRQGIDEMEYVAVVLSQNSVNSEWVKREVDIAMNQEIEGKRVKVLPLVIEDCELPGFLQGKLYADFWVDEQYEDELRKVLRRLGKAHSAPQLKRTEETTRVGLLRRKRPEPEVSPKSTRLETPEKESCEERLESKISSGIFPGFSSRAVMCELPHQRHITHEHRAIRCPQGHTFCRDHRISVCPICGGVLK